MKDFKCCSIDGCNGKYHAKGYCDNHYAKYLKYGDPLVSLREQHRKTGTPEYICWKGMIRRCNDKNNCKYHRYGGRGITICKEWRESFTAFLIDMGEKPFKTAEIDRIDNDGNYEPGNCRWTDRTTNIRNSSATKLSKKDVLEIRELYNTGNYYQFELAEMFGVCKSQIGNITRKEAWGE